MHAFPWLPDMMHTLGHDICDIAGYRIKSNSCKREISHYAIAHERMANATPFAFYHVLLYKIVKLHGVISAQSLVAE